MGLFQFFKKGASKKSLHPYDMGEGTYNHPSFQQNHKNEQAHSQHYFQSHSQGLNTANPALKGQTHNALYGQMTERPPYPESLPQAPALNTASQGSLRGTPPQHAQNQAQPLHGLHPHAAVSTPTMSGVNVDPSLMYAQQSSYAPQMHPDQSMSTHHLQQSPKQIQPEPLSHAYPPQSQRNNMQQGPLFQGNPANYSSGTKNSADLKSLRFWKNDEVSEHEDAFETDADDIEGAEPKPLRFIFVLGILIVFSTIAWLAFRWSTQSVSTITPHIQADPDPFKIKPDNPGGLIVPHQDKLVYGRISNDGNAMNHGTQQGQTEHLLPPPEQPLHPAQQIHPQQPYYPQQPYTAEGHPGGMQPQGIQPPMPPSYGGAPYPVQQYPGYSPEQYPQQPTAPYQEPYPPQQQGQIMQNPQPYPGQYTGQHYPQQQNGYAQQQGSQFQANPSPSMQGAVGMRGQREAQPQQSFTADANGGQSYYPDTGEDDRDEVPSNLQQQSAPPSSSGGLVKKNIQPPHPRPAPKTSPAHGAPTEQDLPTGFFPGTIPAHPPSQNIQQKNVAPIFFKARIGSLATKAAAEKEWERLKTKHKDSFKNLNKAIVKETKNGATYYVIYALGLQNEEIAKTFCKKVGNCSYHKQ